MRIKLLYALCVCLFGFITLANAQTTKELEARSEYCRKQGEKPPKSSRKAKKPREKEYRLTL